MLGSAEGTPLPLSLSLTCCPEAKPTRSPPMGTLAKLQTTSMFDTRSVAAVPVALLIAQAAPWG
jgi:hypothetical protein